MSEYRIVLAHIEGEGAAYKVVCNGGVALFDEVGRFARNAGKLNAYLVEDDNVLELLVAPPGGLGLIEPSATLTLTVLEAAHGAAVKDARIVYEHVWTQEETPWSGNGYNNVHTHAPLNTDVNHGRWAWQDATPFTDADEPAIAALVAQLHAGFAARSYDTLLPFTPVRDAETARALDVDPTELDQRARSAAQGIFTADDFEFYPYDPSELRYHARAGGRLVEVTDTQGRPPLHGLSGGHPFRPPFTVSNINGAWTVVR